MYVLQYIGLSTARLRRVPGAYILLLVPSNWKPNFTTALSLMFEGSMVLSQAAECQLSVWQCDVGDSRPVLREIN